MILTHDLSQFYWYKTHTYLITPHLINLTLYIYQRLRSQRLRRAANFRLRRKVRGTPPAFGRRGAWSHTTRRASGLRPVTHVAAAGLQPAGRPSAGLSKIVYIEAHAAENQNSTRPMLLQVTQRSYMPSFMIVRLQTSEIKRGEINVLGGGFRCSSKFLILLNPSYSR